MQIRILPTAAEAARAAAAAIAEQVRRKPDSVLGLATGRTTVPIYAELVRLAAAKSVDLSRVQTVNLDEFVNLAGSDRSSFRSFMERQLFRHVAIASDRIHFLNGRAADLSAECDRYERLIAEIGGIDLQLLGIGANAHVGFNEPADRLHARTHEARLTIATRRASGSLFGGDVRRVPMRALSMGMATILAARAILLVATGREKARAARALSSGVLDPRRPASLLQLHPRAEALLDKDAGHYFRIAARTE